jgi:sugar (pentulose or hexulose) kinase
VPAGLVEDDQAVCAGRNGVADLNELAPAALESVCFQTRDLVEAMQSDFGAMAGTVLRVDGGMVESDWTMQRLADTLDARGCLSGRAAVRPVFRARRLISARGAGPGAATAGRTAARLVLHSS